MKRYKCRLCQFVFDEDAAMTGWDGTPRCALCNATENLFVEVPAEEEAPVVNIRYMDEINMMAETGQSVIDAMGTDKSMPGWDDILFLGAQLDPMPLERDEKVDTVTIIGKNAKKPMVLENPVFISHMSFGAISREAKTAFAKGSAMAKTATSSGEGGILKEEMEASYKYIFQYAPNLYSVTQENLKNADAVEIKIGQSTKPGLGGHLPAEKVSAEIAEIREKPEKTDIYSPSRFAEINTKEDLKKAIDELREKSEGRPIGVKIAAGRIERDLAFCVYGEPDFITIDCRGGSSGASPKLVRDSTSLPAIYALHRARKYLDSINSEITLIITGGLRVSSDFAKAIAMGADAVAVATPVMIAASCRQDKMCATGRCPVGIATQDPELRGKFNIDAAAEKVANFLNVSLSEIVQFARLTGRRNIHDMCVEDLCTTNREISGFTDIVHA